MTERTEPSVHTIHDDDEVIGYACGPQGAAGVYSLTADNGLTLVRVALDLLDARRVLLAHREWESSDRLEARR